MNFQSSEMAEVAQTAAATAPRLDMYAGIHKALRALMVDTLLGLGRVDTADTPELAETCHRVLELLDFCRGHLAHENEFIHTAIEARAAGASSAIAHDHEEHERAITELADAAAGLLGAPEALRPHLAHTLYRELALFVAHNFEHMHVEESAHNAVLWAHYTDAELEGIHNALVASIPPAEMMYTLRWMVPYMNPAERAALLGDMQRHAPAPAFQAALDVVAAHLPQRDWAKLAASLGLPAVPGLVGATW